MDFSKVKSLTIPEGNVAKITRASDGVALWTAPPYFTNQIPISTDENGDIYNGIGYKTDSRLHDVDGSLFESSGFVTTGFIPLEYYGSSTSATGEVMIYLRSIEGDFKELRLVFYDANKSYLGCRYGSSLVTEPSGLESVYTLNKYGHINSLDVTALTAYYHNASREAKYFRLSMVGIGADSIITVNEEIPVEYTNQLPLSTDVDGSIFNGVGYANNKQLQAGGNVTNNTKYCVTGFIPIKAGSSRSAIGEVMVYFKDIDFTFSNSTTITLFDAEKNYIGMSYGSQFVTEPTPIRVVYTLNENDFINSLDLSAYAGYYAAEESKVAHFMRFCSKAVIDENSIITVNEPIE